jgi:hypothetical protein
MTLERFKTLVEAWERARKVFGDDIAQEAVKVSLARSNKDIDQIGYMFNWCKWLKLDGYYDGAEHHKIDGKRHLMAQCMDWAVVVDRRTPEDIAIFNETLRAVDPEVLWALANGTYVPRKRIRECRGKAPGPLASKWRKKGVNKTAVIEGRL